MMAERKAVIQTEVMPMLAEKVPALSLFTSVFIHAMRDSLELIRDMGVAIEQIRVSGGGARNVLWRQIQADVDGRYLLGYVSSNQANDGTWRTLDVRLNRTDLKSARIRTRKGYFALLRQESIAARPE